MQQPKLQTKPREKSDRHIYDAIHGHYSLPRDLFQFIDNPVYQRLRDLKQLGTTSYVFPSGNHSRFEHCLGVGHLSHKFIKLISKRQPDLEIRSVDKRNLALAGLLHDLGHGPFSHLFDSDVVPALGIQDWSHEQASVDLFEYMIDKYNLEIDPYNARIVSNMILGEGQGYLYQIVNNKLNSIDVDKFDYIKRDSHCVGFREFPFDTDRLMKRSLVISDTICFDEKVVHNIYSMFSSRLNLFQQCYLHRVGQAVGLMIRDALIEAKDQLDLVNRIRSPGLYYKMTDNILLEISESDKSGLEKAKKIIENVKNRKLYTQVGEIMVNKDTPHEHISEQKIVGYNSSNVRLEPEDLVVKKMKLTYGNPADQVWFYDEYNEMNLIPREKVSSLIPLNYCDRFVRVFVKDSVKLEAAKEAFRVFCSKEMSKS